MSHKNADGAPQPGPAAPEGARTGPPAPEVPAAEAPAPEAPAAPDYYDQLLRLKAEFENYRKRVDREKPECVRFGRAEVLLKLLPIYDMLLKAHAEVMASHTHTPLAAGMVGIFREFDKIFKEEGVEPMAPEGRAFDAMLHDVLGAVEREDLDEGTVVDVIQSGFTLHGKALRAAKVRIARRPAKPAEGAAPEGDRAGTEDGPKASKGQGEQS